MEAQLRVRNLVLTLAALAALSACGGAAVQAPGGTEAGAQTPAGAVERFMAHVAEQEVREMGWVFGTPQGPLAAQRSADHVNRRMAAMASVLRHDRYSMQGLVPVLGRPAAREVVVEMRRAGRVYQVPFIVVQGPRERWFVERVGVEAIVGGA